MGWRDVWLGASVTAGNPAAPQADEAALQEVPGVENVDVVLETGALTVTGAELDDDAVRRAVEEAGYQLA